MRSVKFLVAAGAASLLSSMAFAADMPDRVAAEIMLRRRRGFRRLVSARRYWLQQSTCARSLEQRARRQRSTLDQHSASIPPASSASVSAISSTTGSAPTSPANIAAIRISLAPMFHRLGRRRCRTILSRHQVGMAVPGQRLRRSRHLVVYHAVRRRRRRRVACHDSNFTDPGIASTWRGAAPPSLATAAVTFEMEFRLGAHAGLAYKVSPNSRSSSPIAMSISAAALTGAITTFDGINARDPDRVQGHHLARPQARRALESRQPAGLRAAADPQGLIELSIC